MTNFKIEFVKFGRVGYFNVAAADRSSALRAWRAANPDAQAPAFV